MVPKQHSGSRGGLSGTQEFAAAASVPERHGCGTKLEFYT
jgi:hypothetical protein